MTHRPCTVCGCTAPHSYQPSGKSLCSRCKRIGCREIAPRPGYVEPEPVKTEPVKPSADQFARARDVLDRALEQARDGKGLERHGDTTTPFEEQLIVQIGRATANTGFQVGQAVKKLLESSRLEPDRAVRELLGAIMYTVAAVILIEGGE